MYHQLLKEGGAWLGAAREFIKNNFHNGDTVTWSSGDILSPPPSVYALELMGAMVAAAQKAVDDSKTEDMRRLIKDMLFKMPKDDPTYEWRARKLGIELPAPDGRELDTINHGIHYVKIPYGFRELGDDDRIDDGDLWYNAFSRTGGTFTPATEYQLGQRCGPISGTIFIRKV
jgi:hypothetical protein